MIKEKFDWERRFERKIETRVVIKYRHEGFKLSPILPVPLWILTGNGFSNTWLNGISRSAKDLRINEKYLTIKVDRIMDCVLFNRPEIFLFVCCCFYNDNLELHI